MNMEITGKAAHSGGNFTDGISAIEELAHKIIALHAITDLTKGMTVNVGLVSGGQTVNTVAPWAKCEIDLRYVTPPTREDAMAQIERIVETPTCARHQRDADDQRASSSRWCRDAGRRKRLFEHYRAPAKDARPQVEGEFTGGCADFGFTAARRHADDLRGRPGRRQCAYPAGISRARQLVPRAQTLALAILRTGRGLISA